MNITHYPFWPARQPKSLTLPELNVAENIDITARRYPRQRAVVFYDGVLTYAQLNAQIAQLAGYLAQDLGVAKGDRVLLYMQNSPQFIIAFHAILRANAVVVPVSPLLVAEELAYYAQDAGAKVVICGQELFARVAPLRASGAIAHAVVAAYHDYIDPACDLPLPDAVSAPYAVPPQDGVHAWRDMLTAKRAAPPITTGLDDLAVFPYTSGTTGKPKGCMHTHRSVIFNMVAGPIWGSVNFPDAVVLASLPFFHVTGMQSVMNGALFTGATLLILPRWDRNVAARLIERYKVTQWTCITTMMVDFLANPDIGRYDLTSLRRVGGGGAAMPEAVAQKLKDGFGLDYMEGYGLSETMGATHINPPDHPRKQCLGVPTFDTDSRVIDPNTLTEMPIGEQGEIIMHGPQIFQGYWNDPQKTADAFIDFDGKRFFRSGDLGYKDKDGYFYYTDRLKRMINCSGLKVWPAEVEAIMYQHPAIRECCVIAARDAYRGETVKLVAVARPGVPADPAEIEAWARERMAAYKVPRVIEFIDALPVSGTGKVSWRTLQERENAKAAPQSA